MELTACVACILSLRIIHMHIHLTTPSHTTSALTTPGHTTSHLTTPGHTMLHLTTPGHTMSHLTTPGHTTSALTTPGHTNPHLDVLMCRRRLLLDGSSSQTATLTGWGGYSISAGTSLTYDLFDFKNVVIDRWGGVCVCVCGGGRLQHICR